MKRTTATTQKEALAVLEVAGCRVFYWFTISITTEKRKLHRHLKSRKSNFKSFDSGTSSSPLNCPMRLEYTKIKSVCAINDSYHKIVCMFENEFCKEKRNLHRTTTTHRRVRKFMFRFIQFIAFWYLKFCLFVVLWY